MVGDSTVGEVGAAVEHSAVGSRGQVRRDPLTVAPQVVRLHVGVSGRFAAHATAELRQFLFDNVYRSAQVHNEFVKAKKILSELYAYFLNNERRLETELAALKMSGCNGVPTERLVCDLISSMTDRYAMNLYSRLFFPSPTV